MMIRYSSKIGSVATTLAMLAAVCLTLGLAGPSKSQETASDCRPRKSEDGPWRCSTITIEETRCNKPEGKRLQLEPEWAAVNSEDDAFTVLRAKYEELSDAKAFVQWMACQGFRMYADRNPGGSQINYIDATYMRTEINPVPVAFYDIWGQLGYRLVERFVIRLDPSGNINTVGLAPAN